MSLAEFSTALKNKAIKEWFAAEVRNTGANLDSSVSRTSSQQAYMAANVNTLVNATTEYRSAEQTAAKTSFLLTKDTIASLLVDLKGFDPNSPEFPGLLENTFKEFRKQNNGIAVQRKKITVGEDIPAVYFSNISFDGITTLVNNILKLNPGDLARHYEKGHVISLNTELLGVTRDRIAAIDTRGAAGKTKLIAELNNVIDYYRRLDFDSANLQPAEGVTVYASVAKTIKKTGTSKYLVELQPKARNQQSANEVKATIGSIRKLFSPGNLSEKQLNAIIDKLLKSVTDPKFTQDLVNLKSSPTYKDMIAISIASALGGKPVDQDYSHNTIKIATKKGPKVDLSQIRRIAKAELSKAQKLKTALQTKVPLRKITGQFYSLASLQSLLMNRLPEVIKKNMGKGDRRDILNLRTGRLAESATVERISMSREGMISVFYNYMKNPYATFSVGGKQAVPKSRDPKLLISNSIREIAATQVANRMRAVLV